MATRYLGSQIDIHGGGYDLVFPHHCCEIAQTEPATGIQPFAQFWMHAGLVWLDGEKMSKSRGNLVFVRDALTEHSADTLRWYLLGKPYRQEFNYEPQQVHQAAAEVARLHEALHVKGGSATPLELAQAQQGFDAALGDDLNTPLALDIVRDIGAQVHTSAAEGRDVSDAQAALADLMQVLGLQVS
jgi:L-cysteine:1D-myo-inositol 2-amino-2-deoxy-alpha-D-glucopyranoside ligase